MPALNQYIVWNGSVSMNHVITEFIKCVGHWKEVE